jgi:hypothetical protein
MGRGRPSCGTSRAIDMRAAGSQVLALGESGGQRDGRWLAALDDVQEDPDHLGGDPSWRT